MFSRAERFNFSEVQQVVGMIRDDAKDKESKLTYKDRVTERPV